MLRRIALIAALLGSLLALVPVAHAADTVRTSGYLTMADGTKLHYTVVYPASGGPFPTLFEYSGYDPGNNPDSDYIARYVPRGYAFIGVNLRGSGCSGGVWDFFQRQEALDAKEVIAWIIQQQWSNGRVGMIGKSYPGITQLFVAEEQPPGLVAIAPGHTYGDIYRDIAYPGGIFNYSFAALWSFVAQPRYSYDPPVTHGLAAGDATCLANQQGRAAAQPHNPFVQAVQHPWDDELHRDRSPLYNIDKIKIPVWTVLSWQDEQVGPRSVDWVSRQAATNPDFWGIVTNGDHGMYRTGPALADLTAFLDHYVKGVDNGFEVGRPRLKVWWEAGRDGGARRPGFVTGESAWPPPAASVKRFQLNAAGQLTDEANPALAGSDSYAYAPETGQHIGNARYGDPSLPDRYFWDAGPTRGANVAFTTPPLAADMPVLGTASADLWISSTAVDTDLQVTLTEVRPDGKEEFVQQGWLRASHRALDPALSTETDPVPTHQPADQQLLTPGQPVLARVEVFPFGHLFRQGSGLRMYVEAPKAVPDLWGFAALPVPAVNTVLHDAAHPSSLALSVLPGLTTLDGSPVPAAAPACGTVIRQPCRDQA